MKYRGVIVSGLPCSGKSVLCEKLSAEYGWKIFSFGQMWRDKWRIAYPNGHMSFEEYWRNTSLQENKQVNVEGKKLFEKGKFTVDSRYSAFYCKDLPYLRIFLYTPLDVRASRCKEREDKRVADGLAPKARGFEELREVLQAREVDEFQMGLKIFGEDYLERKHYDIMMDTSGLTIQQEFNGLRAVLETTR
jgi:cytidylate kinase